MTVNNTRACLRVYHGHEYVLRALLFGIETNGKDYGFLKPCIPLPLPLLS